MRTLLLAAIAALALPAAAFAQVQTPSMMQAPLPSPASGGVYRDTGLDLGSGAGSTYDFNIMMLKKKMDRLTRQDGGQLTAAHQAELQKELDALNHRFSPRFARR